MEGVGLCRWAGQAPPIREGARFSAFVAVRIFRFSGFSLSGALPGFFRHGG